MALSEKNVDLSKLKIDREARSPRRRSRGSRSASWFPVLLLAALAGVAYLFRRPVLEFVDRIRLPEVEVVHLQRATPASVAAVEGTAANGYIVAARRAALSADTPGRITEMNVTEGSVVRTGDLVARLYDKEYRASYDRALAEVQSSQADAVRAEVAVTAAAASLERARQEELAALSRVEAADRQQELAAIEQGRTARMVAEGILAQRDLDQTNNVLQLAELRQQETRAEERSSHAARADAEAQVRLAEAESAAAVQRVKVSEAARDLAAATLEKTEVRAPFDGVVVLKDAEVGEVVSPNSQGGGSARGSVVTMVDFDSLEVQAEVPETSLRSVRIGAPVQVFLDAYSDQVYRGRVDRIWPTADRQKATVEVRMKLDAPDDRLRPEMGVRVVFLGEDAARVAASGAREEPLAVLIPMEAVVLDAGERGVFVLERDVVRFVALALGEERSGKYSVQEGLRGDERLVLRPPADLGSGDRVRIKEK